MTLVKISQRPDHVPGTDSTVAASFLPTTMAEAIQRGWSALDVVMVTGDAYVDHPAFGPVLIARLLASQGLRVAILAQPDWRSVTDFRRFGRPRLFFGVSAGNIDSMLNRLTAQKQGQKVDPYSPGGRPGLRPDRATLVYANRCREAFADVPIVLGGMEASQRRIAHYDYFSDAVRRPILVDAKADLLVFGRGERPILEISERLSRGESIERLHNIRGTARLISLEDATQLAHSDAPPVELPSYEAVMGSDEPSRLRFADMSRIHHQHASPQHGMPLLQRVGSRAVYFNPPALPLDRTQLDALSQLPFSRRAHPSYHEPIAAYEEVKHTLQLLRGCFGGCSFCSAPDHESCMLALYHSGSQLLVAPEHVPPEVLRLLPRPGSLEVGRFASGLSCTQPSGELTIVPSYISGQPGATIHEMIELALYLKARNLRPLSVDDFIPTPMSLATAMYHTGRDPLSNDPSREVFTERSLRDKKLQRALLLYWDRSQHDLIREALRKAHRTDLIGYGAGCLVPPAHAPRSPRELRVPHSRGPRTSVHSRPLTKPPRALPSSKPPQPTT